MCISLPSPKPHRKKKSPVSLSICNFHETELVSTSLSKDFFVGHVNGATVLFWKVVVAGIPIPVHTVPHGWDWKLKPMKSILNSSVLWGQICISGFFFSAWGSLFWTEGLRKGISFPEKPQELLGHWQNNAWKGRFKWVIVFLQPLDGHKLSLSTLTRLRTTLENF